MTTKEFRIEGMSCNHCVIQVKKALSKLVNLTIEDVQIGKALVRYDEAKVSTQDVARAIDEAGYKVVL